MLPLAYEYPCGYIEEVLFRCVAHTDSHSRQHRSYRELMERQENFAILLQETIHALVSMPDSQKREWKHKIAVKHTVNRLYLAYRNFDMTTAKKIKKQLKNIGYSLKPGERFPAFACKVFLRKIHRICRRLYGLCRRDGHD